MGFVKLERRDHVGIVTIDRPEALNALNSQVLSDLDAVLDQVEADEAVYVVILTGAGRSFVAGADIGEMKGFTSADGRKFGVHGGSVFLKLENLSKPVIAALNGVTAGSGYQLALLCDMRIAHPGVRIGQPEVKSGIPSVTGMYLTWQSLGHSKTAEMMLTGRLLDAKEAAQIGLIAEVVGQEEVESRSIELAEELSQLPAQAFALTKQRIRSTLLPGLKDAFAAAVDIDKRAYGDGEPQRTATDFVARKGSK